MFWGDADLRLVGYCVPSSTSTSTNNGDSNINNSLNSNGLPKSHPQSTNHYLFSIDVKHESNHPDMVSTRNSGDTTSDSPDLMERTEQRSRTDFNNSYMIPLNDIISNKKQNKVCLYFILCYITLYYITLYHITLYYFISYYIISYYIILYYIIV